MPWVIGFGALGLIGWIMKNHADQQAATQAAQQASAQAATEQQAASRAAMPTFGQLASSTVPAGSWVAGGNIPAPATVGAASGSSSATGALSASQASPAPVSTAPVAAATAPGPGPATKAKPSSVTSTGSESLAAIARSAGISEAELLKLNPSLSATVKKTYGTGKPVSKGVTFKT